MIGSESESIAALTAEFSRSCLLTRTRRISRVITSIYDETLRPFGVNSPQFSLLALIARLKGASRAEIARVNFQERSTLSRNLAHLLNEGWVEEVTPKGGRSRPVLLTSAGKKLLSSAGDAWRAAQKRATQLLGDDGVAAIVEAADRLPVEVLGE